LKLPVKAAVETSWVPMLVPRFEEEKNLSREGKHDFDHLIYGQIVKNREEFALFEQRKVRLTYSSLQ
jgi:hypothetical protein